MAAAIELQGVSKSYGSVHAVSSLDLRVPEGSVYGFLGPNGSGKTTTIRMIMNILVPDQGSLFIQGRSVSKDTKDVIGYLPEERGLYPKMKVAELIRFFAELKNVPRSDLERRVRYWLERVELTDWGAKKVNELSKGMQQKIQFIVSVIADPPILILDEPSSGLDPVNANLLREILLELRSQGKTILFSTHRMEEAERLCDHICLISKGHKVLDGELNAIRNSAGKGTVRIDYRGDAQILRRGPGVASVADYGNYAEVQMAPGGEPAALLRWLAPQLEMTRFEMQAPSLNQIFLDSVGATTTSAVPAAHGG